jgi:pimeloyl-ACP methyl ester carboxylesterase
MLQLSRRLAGLFVLAALMGGCGPTPAASANGKPTIVLVHGAFAESSSWKGVITVLQDHGYRAVAAPNPLRSLSADADGLASRLRTIPGPIVLVGHSYGGSVISNAVRGNDAIKALVFVAAFAPEEGESVAELASRFPGSTLADTLESVHLPDTTADLYIRPEKYHWQFAEDVPRPRAAIDAATQRPVRDVALSEPSGPPAWKAIPSWFVFPGRDRNVPVAVHRFMAERAGARETVEIRGASHSVHVSRPEAVARVILRAARSSEFHKRTH